MARETFKIASTTIVVPFIVSFGIVKALANLVSGHFADISIWRARALRVYRFWRDLGYASGALLAGAIADLAITTIGGLTFISDAVVAMPMHETQK